MIGYITRDKTTDVPGSMAHELKMASAESDAVKDMTVSYTHLRAHETHC